MDLNNAIMGTVAKKRCKTGKFSLEFSDDENMIVFVDERSKVFVNCIYGVIAFPTSIDRDSFIDTASSFLTSLERTKAKINDTHIVPDLDRSLLANGMSVEDVEARSPWHVETTDDEIGDVEFSADLDYMTVTTTRVGERISITVELVDGARLLSEFVNNMR